MTQHHAPSSLCRKMCITSDDQLRSSASMRGQTVGLHRKPRVKSGERHDKLHDIQIPFHNLYHSKTRFGLGLRAMISLEEPNRIGDVSSNLQGHHFEKVVRFLSKQKQDLVSQLSPFLYLRFWCWWSHLSWDVLEKVGIWWWQHPRLSCWWMVTHITSNKFEKHFICSKLKLKKLKKLNFKQLCLLHPKGSRIETGVNSSGNQTWSSNQCAVPMITCLNQTMKPLSEHYEDSQNMKLLASPCWHRTKAFWPTSWKFRPPESVPFFWSLRTNIWSANATVTPMWRSWPFVGCRMAHVFERSSTAMEMEQYIWRSHTKPLIIQQMESRWWHFWNIWVFKEALAIWFKPWPNFGMQIAWVLSPCFLLNLQPSPCMTWWQKAVNLKLKVNSWRSSYLYPLPVRPPKDVLQLMDLHKVGKSSREVVPSSLKIPLIWPLKFWKSWATWMITWMMTWPRRCFVSSMLL